MPTYDYECQNCGERFEVFQSMTEQHLKKCGACGQNKLKRLIGTGAGIIFKGSGFYQTDYRSDSYKKAASSDSSAMASAAPSSPAKPSGKTDSSSKKTTSANGE